MPTYDYECASCERVFEVFEPVDAATRKKKCPKCGRLRARRLLGIGAGLVFKGPGFHATDYARSRSGKGGKKGKDRKSTRRTRRTRRKTTRKDRSGEKK